MDFYKGMIADRVISSMGVTYKIHDIAVYITTRRMEDSIQTYIILQSLHPSPHDECEHV